MKTIGGLLLLLVVAAAAAGGGYWYALHHGGDAKSEAKTESGESAAATQPTEEDKPVVPVTTAPLARRTITETVTAYGTVAAQPGEVRALSVPFESRVVRVPAVPGQTIAPGAEVIQVEASPDALVSLQEAKVAVEAATRDLKQAEERFTAHLATNQELSTARQAVAIAQLKLDSLVQRGVGQPHHLKSDIAGIITKVDVQEGQIVPAGGPLVELAAQDRVEVRLGVDPADAAVLKPGQSVQLRRTDRPASESAEPIEGHVRLVEQRVDPTTRLVPVAVTLPANTHPLLDSFVTGQVVRASADALVVPRDAVLPDDDGAYVLYTLKDNHAAKHAVRLGLQDDQDVQVIADDLHEGDPVVVTGNYLLTDGMEVEIKEPTTEPVATTTTASPSSHSPLAAGQSAGSGSDQSADPNSSHPHRAPATTESEAKP